MAACTGTANIARLNNAGRMFWGAIGAGAIQTPISCRTQTRQINITASVTLVRNRRDVRLWQKADLPALSVQSSRALPFLPELRGVFMRRRVVTIVVAAGILIGQLPVSAQTFRTYRCYDGSQFILALFEGDKRAHLQLDGKAVTLPKRISLSGPRYAKGDISLRITKTGITLKRGKQSTECITRSWVGSLLPTR